MNKLILLYMLQIIGKSFYPFLCCEFSIALSIFTPGTRKYKMEIECKLKIFYLSMNF